ncbi:hypothetical protein BDAP_001426 [Binucleata daphniae]
MLTMIISQLEKNNIDGYLFNTSDCHSNEYIGQSDLRLQTITHFTGSNALAFIGKKQSFLWTDGRYHIQAKKELNKSFELITDNGDFFEKINKIGGKIGLDKKLFTMKNLESYTKKAKNVVFVHVDDLIDNVIAPVKKEFNRIIDLEEKKINNFIMYEELLRTFKWIDFDTIYLDDNVTGSRRIDKLTKIREQLNDDEVFITTSLDEIAWLFNLRGSDITYNPVFYSYAIIDTEETYLFMNDELMQEMLRYKEDGNNDLYRYSITVKRYEQFEEQIKKISNKKVKLNKSANSYIHEILQKNNNEICSVNYIAEHKSVKNRTELLGFVIAHIYDAISLCKLFEWIENRIDTEIITEIDVANKLEEYKKKNPGYVTPSFETISSFGENGANIHHKGSDAKLSKDSLFLLDSGSQYYFGTTDITRTLCFGEPAHEQKKIFTAVLKGQLDAITAIIPKKSSSSVLDTLSRSHIWKYMYDYPHSTGHGVGHFLNVHESPPSVSGNGDKLSPDMVFSIEPGYYKESDYGIRIEDLVVTKNKGKDFIEMINLTFTPLQKKMILEDMLSPEHKTYLQNYNAKVRKTLETFMDKNETGYRFMLQNTE